MKVRQLAQLWPAKQVSDGAGVKIRRSIGLQPQWRLDPFLMLDCFGSDEAADYIAGFPPHPHRGFETVTYMLDGHMLHEDHLGNQGHLKSGGVQWMTAGRGIIHSEMPQQKSGLIRGFQLWLNLPAAEKMQDPAYLDLDPAQIPLAVIPQGLIKVIAGTLQSPADAKSPILPETTGPIRAASTQPLYLDLQLHSPADLTLAVPAGHNALIYPYEGEAWLGTHRVPLHHAGVLSDGDSVQLRTEGPARIIVLAGKPLQEPVVQYGPFVMNSVAEIEQAIQDYQQGRLTEGAAKVLQI
ncbi:pirin family protein [Rheinheimera tilapiae]|uniref:Pirin family protein n=1 Tax=Rheinheimera tilapiae TaxID=875043 RepID=A0ABV6BA32_9GAMM